LKAEKLSLLTLPSATLNLRWLINLPDTEIIQMVQAAPDPSVGLIKAPNSSLYGTWWETKAVADAVRRFDLEYTQNMSFSLSVRQLLNA
jgi:HD-like signal output (HDOD) protein